MKWRVERSTRFFVRSDKDNRLRRRYLKPFAAPHIAAHQHVVDADHVVTGLLKLGSLVVVKVAGRVLFLYAL